MLYSIVVLHEAVSLYIYIFSSKGAACPVALLRFMKKRGGGPYKLNNGQLGHVSMTTTPEFQLSKIKRRCHRSGAAQKTRVPASFFYIYISLFSFLLSLDMTFLFSPVFHVADVSVVASHHNNGPGGY